MVGQEASGRWSPTRCHSLDPRATGDRPTGTETFRPRPGIGMLTGLFPSIHPTMNDRVATLLDGRRSRIARALGRSLERPEAHPSPLPEESREHLLSEARDLYWNELEWENLMEEEATDVGEPLHELMFPGLLAFVRGLLLTETNADALAPAEPRPEVVEELLRFLAGRLLEIDEQLAGDGETAEQLEVERLATDRLIDLVLHRFHGLDASDVDALERAR